ncbi:cation transporter [Enterococcus sp. JM4C]|uniref:cation diffusion facilitator family transporter n=1 Tax=Candidatus Enterococcus huntleyi TaxID=1857217 RepID=UPI001379CAB2|nr:cation diffusion facilitator family transporter [Enterococcus sp. JM4C]KAF1296050.1 cation transporter [Enterococcus sp. JM4C]
MIRYLLGKINQQTTENSSARRTKSGILAGILGLLSNGLLFASKIAIGLLSGSVSIMADAINSLSDTASSILTLVGFRIAAKPADREHPYGHERFEYISGLFVSMIVIYVGLQFLDTSFQKILQPENIALSPIVFVILVLSIGIKIWQGAMYKTIGHSIQSKTLGATAQDSLNDVYTTVAVLASALVEWGTGWRIDGYVGFALALYILYSGIQMIKGFVDDLLGSRPTAEEIEAMKQQLSGNHSILGYHDLLIHSYGPSKRFASVHIEVDESWDLNDAHEIIDEIEKEFKKTLGVDLVCHLDPVALHDRNYTRLSLILKEILAKLDENIRMHDFRIETEDNQKILQFDLAIPAKPNYSDKELTQLIQSNLKQQIGEYQLDITFDHNYLL